MTDVNGTLANSSTNAGTERSESKLSNEETNGQVVPSQEVPFLYIDYNLYMLYRNKVPLNYS